MNIYRWSSLSRSEQKRLLTRPVFDLAEQTTATQAIIDAVRNGGDEALQQLTGKFDGCIPADLKVDADTLNQAVAAMDPELKSAIQAASGRIRAFHAADIPGDKDIETAAGLVCSVRYQPLSPVGLYIPGGSAPLLSTILMLAIPAQLAGCDDLVLCTPPGKDGAISQQVLATAKLCGIEKVFCAGGAQAIAAMAYGTGSIPRVSKIFGPGNSWVTMAKQLVSQDPAGCAIDMPAGPSEVVVIADKDASPVHTAWDLLSQAEHGPDSQVILLTDSVELAEAVSREIAGIVPTASRRQILEQSLEAARIIVVNNLESALEISNRYSPEHLIINTGSAAAMAADVRNTGSVFLGPWTPESLGDYCSGTNHVLPTYGWARSYGALGVADFMRRMTLQQASREALAEAGPEAIILAQTEGLEAHAMAVRCRLGGC
jgi:histidinol dehydrogenase